MARKKPRQKKRRFEYRTPETCYFCTSKEEISYKNYQVLERFLSPRKRILPRARTGICAKHQRQLAKAIKQARHLALLPFVIKE
jgi:small subunit ribosomal protein S18